MQKTAYLLFLILISTTIYCQIPGITHNYTKKDSVNNPLLKSFLKEYDFVFAYSDQCCSKQYKILAQKNGRWKCWTYSDNFIQWSKKKAEDKITVDTVRVGTFLSEKKIRKSAANKLITHLTENDFWKLENDSLNQSRVIATYYDDGEIIKRKAVITDGPNYVFNIMTKEKCRIIESYHPEYFVKLFPDMTDRKKFIKNRDYFLNWWETYCR